MNHKLITLFCLGLLVASAAVVIVGSDTTDAATIDGGTSTLPTGITYSAPVPIPIAITGYTIRDTYDTNTMQPTNFTWAFLSIFNQNQGGVISAVAQFWFNPTPAVGTYTITSSPSGVFNQGTPTIQLKLIVRDRQDITVSFDANGGSGTMATQSVPEYTTYTMPQSTFTPPLGMAFSTWKDDRGFNAKPGNSTLLINNVTFSAQWTSAPQSIITFDGNGAGGSMDPVAADIGSTYIAPLPTFIAPAGTMFSGWMYNGTLYQIGNTFTVPTGNITLTAQWVTTETDLTITYVANGASGSMNADTVVSGQSITLPAPTFTPPGTMVLMGWMINNIGDVFQAGDLFTPVNDTRLYAQWEFPPGVDVTHFTVSYDTEGYGSVQSQIIDAGSSFVVRGTDDFANHPPGEHLEGWHILGTNIELTPGTSYIPASDITLTVVWAENSALELSNLDILAIFLVLFALFVIVVAFEFKKIKKGNKKVKEKRK